MPLNKAKGRMFKSVGWTWNPIVGCTHKCEYCWAKTLRSRWGKPFKPAIQESGFKDKFPNDGSIIFVGSMGDLFCEGMEDDWISRVIVKASEATNNRFLFQTKNPKRVIDWLPNMDGLKQRPIIGTTIETNRDTPWTLAPTPTERFLQLWYSTDEHAYSIHDTFLSLEPLSDFDLETLFYMIKTIAPIAIEIGLENYTKYLPKPSPEKVRSLIDLLQKENIIYVLKPGLNEYLMSSSLSAEGGRDGC